MDRQMIDGPVPGVRIAVDRTGTRGAPPLVWLHGELGDFDGPPVGDDVLAKYAVYTPHLPGWGVSWGVERFDRLDDLALALWWVLDDLGLERPLLVGHGLGASLALELAVQQPTRVAGVALAAPYGLFSEAEPGVDLFGTLPKDLMPALYEDPFGPVAMRHFPPPTDAHERGLAAIRRVEVLGAASRFIFPLPDTGIGSRLYRLADTPTALVFGAADGLVPVALASRWRELLPSARTELVDRAAHMFPYETPALGRAILAMASREDAIAAGAAREVGR